MPGPVPPTVLTIAGSDSSGGAGIEADLKTLTALRVYGMAALTSITAQNTVGVHGTHDLSPDLIAQQIDVVVDDIGADAVKSGMLSSAAIIEVVADRVQAHGLKNYVLDPVMISESGHSLLQPSAVGALKSKLIPLALIVTPNIAEAEVLSGVSIESEQGMQEAAKAIHGLGAQHVLVKGGHLPGDQAMDVLYDGSAFERISAERIDTKNTHGTGCTYSAAIAAHLARGDALSEAVSLAKHYVTEAIRRSFDLGAGPGPLNHFWPLDSD